jgi:epoxyqueuosine reductase
MAPSNVSTLSLRIREEARRLGFFKVGIAPACPLPHAEHYRSWLAKGWHGEMRYMERQAAKRQDPGLLLANARSVLVLAMNYYTGTADVDAPLRGRICRYARGDDYHAAVKNRVEQLLGFIRSQAPSAHGWCCVDTGPVMEKVWGAQTALGWMGKHTNLITRDQGSWFFIGVILLDVELEYDCREKDYCGTCRRCIQACPTGAIAAPYALDARLCISYLTIELRGPVPRPLRPLIGNRIYGCDDCQEACPWNRFAVTAPEAEFHPREGNLLPELAPLARVSPEEFLHRFKGSPVRRATRDGFVRNAVIALGNSRRDETIPVLEAALQDASPLVRGHAAWALGQIATASACRILESARTKEATPAVLEEIRTALDSGGSPTNATWPAVNPKPINPLRR